MLAARDMQSNLGSNLNLVQDMTGLDPWVAGRGNLHAKLESAVRSEVPVSDGWRAGCLRKLLSARLHAHFEADETEVERLQGLIKSLVTN